MIEETRLLLGDDTLTAELIVKLEGTLRLAWGGQAVYVKKVAIDVAARRKAIKAEYNMANRRELMAKYGISRGQFYKDLRAPE